MTVYEQIKDMTQKELATVLLQFSETCRTIVSCNCPIGSFHDGKAKGFCKPDRSCALCFLDWLRSEDEIYIDVPADLIEEGDDTCE